MYHTLFVGIDRLPSRGFEATSDRVTVPLLGQTPAQLAELLEGPGRARMVFKALAAGRDPWAENVLPKSLQRRLTRHTHLHLPRIVREVASNDGTVKLVLGLHDDQWVETVLIFEPRRTTLCVSSQVGCGRGCTFCKTATMGLVRPLTTDEIVAQVVLAQRHPRLRPPLRNLVFMGMGEPLDNPRAVGQALDILTDDRGLGFAAKHVTVSTVAPSPRAVATTAAWPGRLAWSLHAAQDNLRRQLVPTQKFDVQAQRDAFAEVCRAKNMPLFVEMALIAGVNDAVHDAKAAAALMADFPTEVRFNLLPMNPIGSDLAPSPSDRVKAFQHHLVRAGYFASVRTPRGQDTSAACGQLVTLTRGSFAA